MPFVAMGHAPCASYSMTPDDITLRKYPYPYRAALSICNDIDGMTLDDFIAIHDFLNSDTETSMGSGLRLNLADSFWFFSNPDTQDHALSYFLPDNKTVSPYAPMIRDMIQAGYIDTLHSYGNFSVKGGFSRELAERSLEEMNKYGLNIRVWVNHGDEHNLQNIGPAAHYLGDKPDLAVGTQSQQSNPNYHTDLLVESGFRYFWDSETSLSKIVGQDRRCSWHEPFSGNYLIRTPGDRLRNIASTTIGLGRSLIRGFKNDRGHSAELEDKGNNHLLSEFQLADGQMLLLFTRYGSGRYDWSCDLALLIRSDFLERLIEVEGTCIVYVHWGDRRKRNDPNPFTPATMNAFEGLAEKFHEGRLWVTTTRRLLDYSFMTHYLDWRVERLEEKTIVHIEGYCDNPLSQKRIDEQDLSGVTFYTNEPHKTEIRLFGKILETISNPKDSCEETSISVPVATMAYPGPLKRGG